MKPKPRTAQTASEGANSGVETAEGEDDRDFARKRNDWFLSQRAYPFAHIPAGARTRALQQAFALKVAKAHSLIAIPSAASSFTARPADTFSSLSWAFDGPAYISTGSGQTPYSGRATSLAIDPANPLKMYLGTAAGGVWGTTDGGQTWSPLTDTQASLAIGALAIDPNNPETIYAGTGEADYSIDSYYGQGLLKSTDGGATWTLISAPFASDGSAAPFAAIVIQPGNSSVLLAATQSGVYRSTDAGETWTNELAGPYVSAVLFDPSNANTAYAGMNGYFNSVYSQSTAAIYKSTDGGVTWKALTGGTGSPLPAGKLVYRTALTIDSAGNLLAALAPSSGGSGTPYKSSDGGTTWTALTAPGDGIDWYRDWIVSVPGSPNILYTGGVDLYQSLDGGVTWTKSTESYAALLWADQHAALFSPDGTKLYVMDDGGLFMTSSPSATDPAFVSLNNSIGSMTFYPGFAITGGGTPGTLVGSQDHGTEIGSAGVAWSYAGGGLNLCGDGGAVVLDAAGAYAYAHCQGSPLSTWMSSATGGAPLGQPYPYGWVSAQTGIDTSDRTSWVAPIAPDPSNVSIVYTGTYRIYQSLNRAQSWSPISGDLTGGEATLNTIAVAPTDANVVYTGAGDGTVSVTHNALAGAQATWSQLTGLPNRSISKVLVAPDSADDVYVVVSGFGSGHIFHSTNGGTAWTDISGNLPDTPTDSVALDPSLQNTLYAATDTGVYVSSNGGTNWETLGGNLPNVVVQDLLIEPLTRDLRIVTHGRGAWDITLPLSGFVASTNILQFGPVAPGNTSTPQTVTLINDLSTAVTLSSITASIGFSESSTCGSSIAGGTTCTIGVSFAPSTAGDSTGTLAIASSQGDLSVALTGLGVASPLVAVTPSSADITTAQSLGVAINVRGGTGTPLPSGTVTLTSGSYSSGAVALNSGSATIEISAGQLTAGTDTLTVTYAPDSGSSGIYSAATGAAAVLVTNPAKTTPTVTVQPAESSITTAQSLSVTVTVAGGNGNPTPTGSVVLSSGSYTSAATLLNGGSAMISIPAGKLGTGTASLSATYTPDSSGSSTYNSALGTGSVMVTQAKTTPTVTVQPAESSITTAQSLSVTVTVAGGNGNPTPTGSVVLSSGSYTSAATLLNGGSAMISIPAGALTLGSDTLTASYSGDGNYNSATGTVPITVTVPPSFTLSASPASVSLAQGGSVTSTVTVTAAGGFAGTVTLAATGLPAGVTSSFAAGSTAGTQVVTLTASTSAAVTSDPVTVTVTGTSGTLAATTNIAVSVTPEPGFTAGSGETTSITLAPGATTGNTGTISVVGTNGFSGTVTLTCQVTTTMTNVSDAPGCSLNPTSLALSGTSAQTSTLTVTTTAASSAENGLEQVFGRMTGGTALAVVLFFLVPTRRRSWLAMSGLVILIIWIGAAGCSSGGGGGTGGGGGGNPGTTAGPYTITITGTSGEFTATVGTISLTVQ